MTTLELIQSAKRHSKSPLLDESALTTEVDSAIPISSWVRFLNDSISRHMEIVRSAAQEYFGAKETISFVAGTQEYSLPGNSVEIRLIERTDTNTSRILSPILINDRLIYENSDGDYNPVYDSTRNYFWNNLIGFSPTPTVSATGNINVLYIRRLPDVNFGTAASVAVDGTTITLATTPTFGATPTANAYYDDYYNNATIQIISATAGAGQRRKITDYVGATKVCTLESALNPVPTGTIVYDIVCDIPEQYHPVVAMWVAILAKTSDDDTIGQLKPLYDELKNEMTMGLVGRQSQESRSVRFIET